MFDELKKGKEGLGIEQTALPESVKRNGCDGSRTPSGSNSGEHSGTDAESPAVHETRNSDFFRIFAPRPSGWGEPLCDDGPVSALGRSDRFRPRHCRRGVAGPQADGITKSLESTGCAYPTQTPINTKIFK
jgi:hypothetical protein